MWKLLFIVLLVPVVALGATVPWNRPASGSIYPLYTLDTVFGNIFAATSTTATSTFPVASTTKLCIADTCNTSWPTSASSTLLSDNNTFSGSNILNGVLSIASSTINGNLTVSGGNLNPSQVGNSSKTYPFMLGASASTSGTVIWTGATSNPFFGIYDANNSLYYGISKQLAAPAGTAALGGYYAGLGVGGSTNGQGNPIFGVLTSTQSGNGVGSTAFTVTDNNNVFTFNNTLDNGSGGTNFSGASTFGNTLGVTGLSTLTAGFLSKASSTVTSGLFSMNGGASTTVFTASGNGYFGNTLEVTGLSTLTGGFLSAASSTVGNGTQTGGLTINGFATTTNNLLFTTTGTGLVFRDPAVKIVVGADSASGQRKGSWATFNGVENYGGVGAGGAEFIIHSNGSTTPAKFALIGYTGSTFTTRFTALSSGQVGIGTTTPNYLLTLASSTQPQLALTDGSLTSNQWTFRNAGGQLFIATSTYSATSTVSAMSLNTNGSLSVANLVSCAGVQTSAAGLMSCTSDARLKDIHAPFTVGLDAIMKIHPQTWSYKQGTESYDGVNYSSFIAQDVQKAVPEAVNEGYGGWLQINMWTVLSTAVNAIKELATHQSEQDKQIAELRAEIAELKAGKTTNFCPAI